METKRLSPLFSVLLLFALLFSGCSSKEQADATTSTEAMSDAAPSNEASSGEVAFQKQMLIKDAQVKFQVEDLETSTQRIEAAVKKADAVLTNTSQHQQQDKRVTQFEIRVKPDQFVPLLEQLEKESVKLEYRTLSSHDVAAEFVDVQARLKAKRAVEQQYLTLLNQAKTIKEILEVEQYLNGVREEIERADARLQYLKNQTAYSTITLEIYQLVPLSFSERIGLGTRVYNALGTGWQMFLMLLVGLCYIWPLLLLGVSAYVLRRRLT